MRLDGSVDVGLLGRAQPSHGFELALVGRSPAGREHVGVQWEVKPLGTPFTGLGLGSAPLPYDTGAPGSTAHPAGAAARWRSSSASARR